MEDEKLYRKLDRTQMRVDVAREAITLSRENVRLSENRVKAGAATGTRLSEAVATTKKAEMEELQAPLDYRLAHKELERISGTRASER